MTIEEKITQVKSDIKLRLDESNMKVTSISAYFDENRIQQDGLSFMDVIVVRIVEPRFNKKQFIIVDPESLEVLYVQTGLMLFSSPSDYFETRDEDHYD
ncbi:MAG: hypothetical protein GQ574_28750 [Crocinitomix sp.]|nr:hypothetical protein [Crocinitomix sp.]